MFRAVLCVFLVSLPMTASSEIIRCTVVNKSHSYMPDWVEYELDDQGVSVVVRDEFGAELGRKWILGSVEVNTPRKMTITWDVGILPKQSNWWDAGKLFMRLTRFPDGRFRLTGTPSRPSDDTLSYTADARCGA